MTTVTLRIQVDKSGASEGIRAVKGDLQGVGQAGQQAGQQASGGINTLRGALDGAKAAVASFLAVYAGIQALSGVVRLADEYAQLQGQLRLVTGSTEEFAAAQAGVFSIAQQSGTALSGVNALYASLARSTEDLGLSQGQLLTITQAVSQSMAVSNTSAAAASGAITQLGQAFASGVLRGDEFNSVNEAAPRIMDALAASLGVSRGELRAMAEASELTSDVLAAGLLQQAPQISAEFDTMGDTVGRAFQRLSNAVLQFVGEANQATGAGAALAAIITGLANNLPAFVAGLGAVAGGYAAITAAAAVANPAIGFTGTLLAGLATALGVVVAAYSAYKLGEYLANEFQIVREAGAYLIISLNAVWEAIKNGAFAAFTALQVAFSVVVDAIQEKIADLLASFIELGQFEIFGQSVDFTYGQAEALDTLVQSLRGATDGAAETDAAMAELRAKFDASAQASQELSDGLFEGITAYFETRTSAGEAADAVESVGQAAKLSDKELKELKKAMDDGARAALAIATETERLAAEMGGDAVAAAIELAQRLRSVDERQRDLTAAYNAGGLSLAEYTAAMQSANTIRATTISQYQQEAQRLRDATSAVESYLQQLREEVRIAGLTGTARTNAIRQMEAEQAARRLLTNATDEQVRALADQIVKLEAQKDAADEAGRAAEDWARYWQGASDAVVGAFADLFSGGIDSLEDFGDQMLQISKRIVSDILREFARTGQIRLPTGSNGTMQGNIAAGIQGLGLAYGGYQNAQQGGNPLATVGSFALAGAQIGSIFPVIGTAIGAVIGAVVGAAVELFGGDNDPLLRVRSQEFNGQRRSEGQARSALGDIFVRTENTPNGEGTSPEIAARIAEFDNLIASVLSEEQLSAVRAALANVNDTFENGAFTVENALNARFESITGALSQNIQEFVGTAGTLQERLSRFFDAVAIEAIAGFDNGISQDFGELADLFARFRIEGEGIGDVFLRLTQGMGYVNDALLLLGGTFQGTGLEAATFAGELIELAGGMEGFTQRLQGALEALFSEEERNQFLADQAQQALNQSLRDLNISGVGLDSIRQQLRDQLRSAMEAGNAELVNQILIAANQLGAFSTALEALGEDAVAAAQQVALGGTSLRPGGSLGGDAGTGSGGTATAPATQLAAGQETVRVLNAHTGLLQQIATNTAVREDPGAEKAARDTASAAAAQLAVMREIKQILEAEARSAVQAALKATTGANGSGVKRRAVSA